MTSCTACSSVSTLNLRGETKGGGEVESNFVRTFESGSSTYQSSHYIRHRVSSWSAVHCQTFMNRAHCECITSYETAIESKENSQRCQL